jgi:flagellar biosynthetic protein FliR
MIAPMFAASCVPWRGRIVFALALTMLVVPGELARSASQPIALHAFMVQAGAELIVGATLGLGVLVMFTSMHVAGQMIAQLGGIQLGDVLEPGADTSSPGFSQLLFYVALAVFLAIGGHRHVLEALLDTYAWMPTGQGALPRGIVDAMVSLLTHTFALAIRAAAPALVALTLATLILSLVSRTLPQWNIMSLGFGLNAMAAMAALGVTLGAAVWIFQDQLELFLHTTLASLHNR